MRTDDDCEHRRALWASPAGRSKRNQIEQRPVASSIEELIAGATLREPLTKNADSLSGSSFERVVISGRPYVLKHLHVDDDWIQRATGDIECRPLVTWRAGLYHELPQCIDHTVAGVAGGLGRNGWGAAVLMHDVSPWLVQVQDGRIGLEQHRRLLDHMAQMHASFWGWRDTIGLMPLEGRYTVTTPAVGRLESERGGTDPVPGMIVPGWERVRSAAPSAYDVVSALLDDPAPLTTAIRRTPLTFVHGDWKAGNLGTLPDGRTVLLDFAFHGEGPACTDLAWYIAVNCDLLPETKEQTIAAYRARLEAHGVDTSGWWDQQLALALVGVFVFLGWSKSGDELAWWAERIPAWARRLR